jgi:hypothetical protein
MKKRLAVLAALTLVAGSARAQEGFIKDQYRLPAHTAFICKSAAERVRVYEYIKANYPKHHYIEGSADFWTGKMNPPTESQISSAVQNENMRWRKGCENLCPILKSVKPNGSNWVNAGQYDSSFCYDTWIKLVSRASGRIEAESVITHRLIENPSLPKYPITHQIKCSTREYWLKSKSVWAPIDSRTLLDKAAKAFC